MGIDDDRVRLDDTASVLWAHEQIRQLKSRYFAAVDEKDYAGIAALFTDAAIADFTGELRYHVGHHGVTSADLEPAPAPVVGGLAIAEVIKQAIDGLVTVHHGHDALISVVSDVTARGRWSMYDSLVYEHETMHGYGHYHEEYLLAEGSWRFTRLTLTRRRVAWTLNAT